MTDQHAFSWKRIALFGASSALVLITAALIPLVGIRLDAHSDRIEKVHLEHRGLYKVGLERCPQMPYFATEVNKRRNANEIDIYINPVYAISSLTDYGYIGVRASPTGVTRFSHDFWSFYPPPATLYPPPPPPGEQQVSDLKNTDNPEPPRQWDFETNPEVHLHPLLGEQLVGLLWTEIDIANTPMEPDGVEFDAERLTYTFIAGDNCARTLLHKQNTRARKFAELADELVSLSEGETTQTSKARSNIRRIIIELEYQTRMFGSPDSKNIQPLSPAPRDGRE